MWNYPESIKNNYVRVWVWIWVWVTQTAVQPPYKDFSSDSYSETRGPHPWGLGTRCRCWTWPFSLTPGPEAPVWHTAYTLTGLSLDFIWPLTYKRTLQTPNTPEHLAQRAGPLNLLWLDDRLRKGVLRYPTLEVISINIAVFFLLLNFE